MEAVKRRPPTIPYDVQPQGASVVYWIHRQCHTDMFNEGYIGITKRRVNQRWSQHQRQHRCIALKNALNKYDDIVMDIVLVADTRAYCEEVERKLRPRKNIGWNINVGGDEAVPSNTYNTTPGGMANAERWKLLWETDPRWIERKAQIEQETLAKEQRERDRAVKRARDMIKREYDKAHRFDKARKHSTRNTSGYTGVTWFTYPSGNGAWRAQFRGKGLGYFDDAHSAHEAYLNAKRNAL